MMGEEKELEEIMERMMKFPKAVAEQLKRHTELIADLVKTNNMLLELICKLHDIDVDELRKEYHSLRQT